MHEERREALTQQLFESYAANMKKAGAVPVIVIGMPTRKAGQAQWCVVSNSSFDNHEVKQTLEAVAALIDTDDIRVRRVDAEPTESPAPLEDGKRRNADDAS